MSGVVVEITKLGPGEAVVVDAQVDRRPKTPGPVAITDVVDPIPVPVLGRVGLATRPEDTTPRPVTTSVETPVTTTADQAVGGRVLTVPGQTVAAVGTQVVALQVVVGVTRPLVLPRTPAIATVVAMPAGVDIVTRAGLGVGLPAAGTVTVPTRRPAGAVMMDATLVATRPGLGVDARRTVGVTATLPTLGLKVGVQTPAVVVVGVAVVTAVVETRHALLEALATGVTPALGTSEMVVGVGLATATVGPDARPEVETPARLKATPATEVVGQAGPVTTIAPVRRVAVGGAVTNAQTTTVAEATRLVAVGRP